MKIVLLLFALSFSAFSIAQDDSTGTATSSQTYKGIASLTRSDIERLPASNFSELIQAAFPFVRNEYIEDEYSFIVNGFVLIEANAINISQIENISFFPAGTAVTRGSLSQKGTFVINTRPEANTFSFSTKTGLLISGDRAFSGGYTSSLNNGFFTINELTYQNKSQRAFLSSSISFLRDESPDYTVEYSSLSEVAKSNMNRLRFSNFGAYQFNQQWKIEGGLFYSNQPSKLENAKGYYAPDIDIWLNQNNKFTSAGAHALLSFSPSNKLTNRLIIEASHDSNNEDGWSGTLYENGRFDTYTRAFNSKYKTYSFADQFIWQPITTPAISLQASILARYQFANAHEEGSVEQDRGGQIFTSESSREFNRKSFSVSPAINFDLKKILFAEIGATYDNYETSFYGDNTQKEILPNAGIRLELASVLNIPSVSSITLSSNYNQYLFVSQRFEQLSTRFGNLYQVLYVDTKNVYTPSKTWVSTAAVGLLNDRIAVQASYRKQTRIIRAYEPLFFPTDTYSIVFQPLSSNTISFELKTAIVQKEKINWNFYSMLFKEKFDERINLPADPVYFDAGKMPWKGGLRTSVDVNRLFMQASLLLSFNELGTDDSGMWVEDMNKYYTNFLLIGYKLPEGLLGLKGIEVNAQTRNLFGSEVYTSTKYVGAGIHINF